MQHLLFHIVVNWRSGTLQVIASILFPAIYEVHAWIRIYFEQPRLQINIYQHVEAENLIRAPLVIKLVLVLRLLRIRKEYHEIRERRHRRLAEITDVLPHGLWNGRIIRLLLQLLHQRFQRPLGRIVRSQHIFNGRIVHAFLRVLIDVEIRHVHVRIVEVLLRRILILLGAEAGNALVRHVGMHLSLCFARDYHVNAEVKLQSINEVRIIYVSLHHNFLMLHTLQIL